METLKPFSVLFSSAFNNFFCGHTRNARFFRGSEVEGGVMRIAQGRFGRELLTVQDGSVAASATQPALHWRGVGVGTRG